MRKKDIYKASKEMVESASQGPSSWAQRLLEKQGWKGGGLGKQEDGMKTHIKVVKKDDTSALGFKKVEFTKDNDQWFLGIASGDPFSGASIGGKAAVKSLSKEDSDCDECGGVPETKRAKKRDREVNQAEPESQSEIMDVQSFYQKLFQETGGQRLGMRARRDQPGKWARAEVAGASSAKPFKVSEKLDIVEGDDDVERDEGGERKRKKLEKKQRKEAEREEEVAREKKSQAKKQTKEAERDEELEREKGGLAKEQRKEAKRQKRENEARKER